MTMVRKSRPLLFDPTANRGVRRPCSTLKGLMWQHAVAAIIRDRSGREIHSATASNTCPEAVGQAIAGQ